MDTITPEEARELAGKKGFADLLDTKTPVPILDGRVHVMMNDAGEFYLEGEIQDVEEAMAMIKKKVKVQEKEGHRQPGTAGVPVGPERCIPRPDRLGRFGS